MPWICDYVSDQMNLSEGAGGFSLLDKGPGFIVALATGFSFEDS